MQNKLYAIQFFSWLDDQFPVSPWAATAEPQNHEFQQIPKKVWTPGQKRIWTHGKEKSRELPAPWPVPIHKLSVTSMVWIISIGQLGYLSGCTPSQLLHTCSLAEYKKLEKVLISEKQLKTSALLTFFSY